MKSTIRKYQSTDKAGVIDLVQLNTPRFFAEEEIDDLDKYLKLFSDNYFVSENEGEIISAGGFNLMDDGITVRLSWDIIHPEFQGKGLGRELVLFRIEQIKQIPNRTTVQVRTSQLVWKFYEKLGFSLDQVQADYWAPGFDLYDMSCQLRG